MPNFRPKYLRNLMPLTHYEILGLAPTATAEEIKRAYRRQALHWHPDRNPADPKAHRRFIAIKDAYAVLSNSERRAYYDAVLNQREAAKRQPPPFQQNYPPPRPHRTSYTPPPPQYRPVYRERPRSRGWSGAGIGLLIFILFRFLSMCNQRPYDVDDTKVFFDGIEQPDTRVALDSLMRATGGLKQVITPISPSSNSGRGTESTNETDGTFDSSLSVPL